MLESERGVSRLSKEDEKAERSMHDSTDVSTLGGIWLRHSSKDSFTPSPSTLYQLH